MLHPPREGKLKVSSSFVALRGFSSLVAENMSSIRTLEKPKGCMRVLTLLREFQPASISDIMRSTCLSQRVVYSSLKRMKRLGIVDFREEKARGRPNLCSLTDWGNCLGHFVFSIVDTLREVSGKHDVDQYLTMPVGSLSILIHIYQKGSTNLTEARSELGLCWYSVTTSFKRLTHLGLIGFEKRKGFRRTTKEYKLTKEGELIARYLDTIDMALRWKGG
ncbi:MAG: ArsR family transcriptional regulator [Thermoplasmata archaeon]|nr:ArsR family transcriptional regulator [Thermoplasmata archaeon]